MSQFYIEENNEPTLLTFNKKVIYNEETLKNNYSNLIDFNFGEKFFYGRVDFNFNPIYYNTSYLPIKHFKEVSLETSTAGAAPFVVDAFNDLARQFQKKASNGGIDPNEPFLSSLRIYKAYTDPIGLYESHLDNYMAAMANQFVTRNIQVQNFKQFMHHFTKLIHRSAREFPFTMPAYIKSKFCPIHASGLVVEIADVAYFNDEKKIQEFVNSKNWNFYLNACNSYGFMVDKAIPWRLVADIASNEMLKYSAKYKLESTFEILKENYSNAHYRFINRFRSNLLKLYNMVRPEQITMTEQCAGITKQKLLTPSKYKIADIQKLLSDEALLRLYCNIRIIEDPSDFEHNKAQRVIRDCVNISNSTSLFRGVTVFENIINQPFDYRGSLSYINKQIKLGVGGAVVFSKLRR